MKKLSILIFAFGLFFSCTPQMQLVSLKSTNPGLDEKTFVYQDSMIKVAYNFYSPNGTLKFKIYNKYSKPIFIDWKNSSFLIDADKKFSYWKDESTFSGTSEQTNIKLTSWLSTCSGTIHGKITKPERISMLPPKTEISVSKFKLTNGTKFRTGAEKQIISEKNNWKKTHKPTEIALYKYSTENTPLNFRNFITIAVSEDFKNPKYYDFGFWISEIEEMNGKQLVGDFLYQTYMDSTQSKSYHPYKQANRFFVRKK